MTFSKMSTRIHSPEYVKDRVGDSVTSDIRQFMPSSRQADCGFREACIILMLQIFVTQAKVFLVFIAPASLLILTFFAMLRQTTRAFARKTFSPTVVPTFRSRSLATVVEGIQKVRLISDRG